MKTKNVTFSLPLEVIEMLQTLVEKQKMSQFVSSALISAIEKKQQLLKAEYLEANNDPDRLKTINEWKHLDAEGWE